LENTIFQVKKKKKLVKGQMQVKMKDNDVNNQNPKS